MIGPSSGTSSVPNHEATDNSVRVKRKLFDDLDIESFCEEVCQNGKKRYHLTELQAPIDVASTIDHNSDFSSISSQELTNTGPVARLEVLVVDGTWDTPNLAANLTDLTSIGHCSSSDQSLVDIQSMENTYGTIPCWESPNSVVSIDGTSNVGPEIFLPPSMPAEDQENGNLSWLLDFKLDSLIEAPEDKSCPMGSREHQNAGNKTRFHANNRANGSTVFLNESKRSYGHEMTSSVLQQDVNSVPSSYTVSENRNLGAGRYNGPKKPPFTYTELIEHALQEKGELTVSAIYQWISEHFPYYKSNDDRWKNSVRHNLSINPHFRKGSKAPHGAGHLWAIANRGDSRTRQITPNGNGSLSSRQIVKNIQESNSFRKNGNNTSQIITMDEVAAATASIQQPEDNSLINSVTLEHCAEQILSGIKREVEVQYLVPMMVSNNGEHDPSQQNQHNGQPEQHNHAKETDFLNPVSKEVVAEECGLIGEGYLVTDLNPMALGLNMVEPEIITPENLFDESKIQNVQVVDNGVSTSMNEVNGKAVYNSLRSKDLAVLNENKRQDAPNFDVNS